MNDGPFSARHPLHGAPTHLTRVWLGLIASCCFLALAAAAPRATSADQHPKLPPGEGRDVMIRVCSQCHDPEWAAEYGNDEQAWRATVEQMRKQGAVGTDAEFEQVVKYLTSVFPPK
jgi:competence protein ComEA